MKQHQIKDYGNLMLVVKSVRSYTEYIQVYIDRCSLCFVFLTLEYCCVLTIYSRTAYIHRSKVWLHISAADIYTPYIFVNNHTRVSIKNRLDLPSIKRNR